VLIRRWSGPFAFGDGPEQRRRKPKNVEWDAFISYCHADKPQVADLHAFLQQRHLPWKRPKVFCDQTDLVAGELDPQIKSHLESSRLLILCWSRAASESNWVAKEQAHFLTKSDDAVANVVVCRASETSTHAECRALHPGDQEHLILDITGWERAAALRAQSRSTQPGTLIEELRRQASREEAAARAESRALVARLYGLKSKRELSTTRSLIVSGAGTLLALALALTLYVRWWNQTPDGYAWHSLESVLQASEGIVLDQPTYVDGCVQIASLGFEAEARGLAAAFSSPDLERLANAAISATLPDNDCSSAQRDLEAVDRYWRAKWPRAELYVSARCRTHPRPALLSIGADEGTRAGRFQDLAVTGHYKEITRLPGEEFSPWMRALALAKASSAHRVPYAATPAEVAALFNRFANDGGELLYQMRGLLLELDWGHGLRTEPIRVLRTPLIRALMSDDFDLAVATNWSTAYQIAAHLADDGTADLQALIARLNAHQSRTPTTPVWAATAAWRALLLQRMGRNEDRRQSWTKAIELVQTSGNGGRTWSEIADLVEAAGLAGHWCAAFDASLMSRDPYRKIEHGLLALRRWHESGGGINCFPHGRPCVAW
jgi:hypothetical protein